MVRYYAHCMGTSKEVLISGVVAVLAGLNLLKSATFMTFKAPTHLAGSNRSVSTLMAAGGVLLAACAALGIFTGIALLWRQRWSRISIQVFGAALAVFSVPAFFGALTATRVIGLTNQSEPPYGLAQVIIHPAQVVLAVWWQSSSIVKARNGSLSWSEAAAEVRDYSGCAMKVLFPVAAGAEGVTPVAKSKYVKPVLMPSLEAKARIR